MPSVYSNREQFKQECLLLAERFSRLFSLWSKPENIESLTNKQRLAPRHIEKLKNVWQVLEETYPGRVDLQYNLIPNYDKHLNTYGSNHEKEILILKGFKINFVYAVIHFPKVTIVNSNKNSIDINDLYVRIPMEIPSAYNVGNIVFHTLEGARPRPSITEYIRGYRHSHLGTLDYHKQINIPYSRFCMGNADYLSSRSLLNHEFDIDIFTLMLHQIVPYISWESLVGVPYILLESVVNKQTNITSIYSDTLKEVYKRIIRFLKNKTFPITFDWRIKNGKYYIVDNEKFDLLISEIASKSRITDNNYYCYRDEKGEYYKKIDSPEIPYQIFDFWIPFRNQKVKFEITGEVKIKKSTDIKYLNPKIKEYVKYRLEYTANLISLRQTGASK